MLPAGSARDSTLRRFAENTVVSFKKIATLLCPEQRRQAIALFLTMLVSTFFEMVSVGAVIPALSFLSTSSSVGGRSPFVQAILDFFGNPSDQQVIAGGLIALLAVYVVKNLVLTALAWQQSTFLAGLMRGLSDRLFATYMSQPWAFHLQRNSAQLIRNNTSEITMFVNGCHNALLFGTEALVAMAIGLLLVCVEPVAAVLVGLVIGLATVGLHLITRRRLVSWGRTRQNYERKRIQDLQQGLGGAKDVKLLGRESEFIEEYRQATALVAHAYQRQYFVSQLPRLWYEMLAVAGLVLLGVAFLIQGASGRAMIPRLGLFAAAAFRLLPSLNRIVSAWQSLIYLTPIVDTLGEELALPSKPIRQNNFVRRPFTRDISLQNVTFAYPKSHGPSISEISLTIRKGSSVGIIGGSGAGKSTLVDLLLGLLSPDSGVVSVDGANIQADLRGWQNNLGYVPQTIFLTDDSIRRNVAFGVPSNEIDDVAVEKSLRAAQLDQFVAGLPAGVDTVIGERGVRLSGGQRQRIGIARALYFDPPILVLDEATSSLDTSTENDVMEAVNRLHGSKTLVIVAHRLSTVSNCDTLFELVNGKVSRVGTFAEVAQA